MNKHYLLYFIAVLIIGCINVPAQKSKCKDNKWTGNWFQLSHTYHNMVCFQKWGCDCGPSFGGDGSGIENTPPNTTRGTCSAGGGDTGGCNECIAPTPDVDCVCCAEDDASFFREEKYMKRYLAFNEFNTNGVNLFVTSLVRTDIIDCEQECNDQSEYCLGIKKNGLGKYRDSLLKFYHIIKDSKGVIDHKTIMDTFEIKADPCNRSNWYLKDGVFKNFGKNCISQAVINITSRSKETISILIPSEVIGKYEYKEGRYILEFTKKEQSPEFQFSSELQQDFGGYIRKVILTQNRIILSTDTGCIKSVY